MNDYQKKRFTRNIVSNLFNTVTGKKIAIFGFAFKKDTGDTWETAACFVCADLLEEQAQMHVYDPKVTREQMMIEFEYTNHLTPTKNPNMDKLIVTETDPYLCAAGAHAIAILTEWDEFKTYDFKKIYDNMAKPCFILDGRNVLDHDVLRKIGFNVECIWKAVSDNS